MTGNDRTEMAKLQKKTFLVCEDNANTRDEFTHFFGRNPAFGIEYELKFAGNITDALEAIKSLTDDDVISLDSRLPAQGDGEAIYTALRSRCCNCLALWHSTVPVPEFARNHCFSFDMTAASFTSNKGKWEGYRVTHHD